MSNKHEYTPQELARMTGEAMIAWSKDPCVELQCLTTDGWVYDANDEVGPVGSTGRFFWASARRIKPAKRKVPLDQSDFVGPNRVTHIRAATEITAWAVVGVNTSGICVLDGAGAHQIDYPELASKKARVSRDGGLTWGPAEKEVES